VLPPAAGTSDPCCRGTSWPAGFNPLARGWSKHCHWERTTVLQKPKHAEQGHQHHIYVDASDTELLTDGFRTQLAGQEQLLYRSPLTIVQEGNTDGSIGLSIHAI
jgi:hypothetical protein